MAEPAYVAARAVLLDALAALEPHLSALILVGAQAVYLRSGEAELAVAPYTTDGDIAINPLLLQKEPELARAMSEAKFDQRTAEVGRWLCERTIEGTHFLVPVDLLVPAAVGGPGRRGARLEGHDSRAARKVVGLEASLVDNDPMDIGALAPSDSRKYTIRVAGPAALFVAKTHKIAERRDDSDRVRDKDALDVYRLLRSGSTDDIAARLRHCLEDAMARDTAAGALVLADQLFGDKSGPGSLMAARAGADDEEIALGVSILVTELLAAAR